MNARSLEYTRSGGIELVEVSVPDPLPGEVQISGSVCGICAWDIATCGLGEDIAYPAPPGHEGIGVVRKVGAGVTHLQEGDKVALGGFQTLSNRKAENAFLIPDSDIADEYWLVEPASCVVTGVDVCRLDGGEAIVVLGAGFMGLMMIQLLVREHGIEPIALDIDADRLELAASFGAQETHDQSGLNQEEVAKELYSRNVDIVIDSTGAQAALDLAGRIVRPGGMINLFGWIKGEVATFDPSLWHARGLTIVNASPRAGIRNTIPIAIELIADGVIDVRRLVTDVVDLEGYPALMERILAGYPEYIKGVVSLR